MAKRPEIEWSPRTVVAVNARLHLPDVAAAYFREARKLLEEVGHPTGLHRLRLISKRFRYTLEFFRPHYPPALSDRIDALKRVQELLGDINDAVVTGNLIADMPRSVRMREHMEKVAHGKADEFRAEWRERFDAPGSESWWIDFLRSAAPPSEAKARVRKAPAPSV